MSGRAGADTEVVARQGGRLWWWPGGVWGFSHLRFCPAGLGLGLESWHRRDGKATGLIQGSFFSELWAG